MQNGGHPDKAEQLAALAACFVCSSDSAALLMAAMTEKRFPAGTNIALRGDPSAMLFLILDGNVVAEIFGIDGQQAQLTRHGPGEIFGAFPTATHHRADFRATAETRLLSIPAETLSELGAAAWRYRGGHRRIARAATGFDARPDGRAHRAIGEWPFS